MEVASPNSGGVSPFQHRDVREWSRMNSITGVLERARLETDHWAASASGQKHQYGKVVDSRARTGVEGSLQQRRQLEVFQSQVPGGRLQVVRTHSVASRSWSSNNTVASSAASENFEDLQLAVNPLDLSSQKSKASVGRSGGRRPPTRPRLREDAAKSLHRVSRLCHQLHEEAVQKTFKIPSISERQSGDGSPAIVTFGENESNNSNDSDDFKRITNGHSDLSRTKSNSSEDLHKSFESTIVDDINDFEQLENWRRTSKIRRSFQFPKQVKPVLSSRPPDLPVNTGSVRKIKEDLETGRRLNTALRGNNVDLEALDQILQSISSSSSVYSDLQSPNETPERDNTNSILQSGTKQKKSAFITVESLQAVRGRLKPLNSPVRDIISTYETKVKGEETDDGIETEDNNGKSEGMATTAEMPTTRVRSYVYGMEAMLNRKPVSGTGSLESRSSNKSSGSGGSRSEDWYNRRKSYGFEQVHNQQEQNNSIAFKSKSKVESSTDSGICRSTEIVLIPPDVKVDSDFENESNDMSRYGKINSMQLTGNNKETTTGSYSSQKAADDEVASVWNRIIAFNTGSQTMDANWKHSQRDVDSGTITIPITSSDTSKSFETERKDPFAATAAQDYDTKRHSIAVDESKYVTRTSDLKLPYQQRRTSLALGDTKYSDNSPDDDDNTSFKKQKKVEFCKTEVHFAAESGRVNIVETDEKPPPTNNFRRRRRSAAVVSNQLAEDAARNGLPVLHFGDSTYEKTLFGVSDREDPANAAQTQPVFADVDYDGPVKSEHAEGSTVTVNSTLYQSNLDDELRDLSESDIQLRGILKNKPIKPRPYHLGENDDPLNGISSGDDQENKWGVRLRPVQRDESRMWKSTVTLRNNTFDGVKETNAAATTSTTVSSEIKSSDTEIDQNEIQLLLKSLKPAAAAATKKSDSGVVSAAPVAANSSGVGVNVGPLAATTMVEHHRVSAWTVADRIKQVEDMHWTENKGYSTKVNFGGGQATVVESNLQQEYGAQSDMRHNSGSSTNTSTTWPRKEDTLNNDFVNLRISTENTTCSTNTKQRDSSIVESFNKKVYVPTKMYNKCDLKSATTNETLSSPSLVGQNLHGPKTSTVPTAKTPKSTDIGKYFTSHSNSFSINNKSTQDRSHLLTVPENNVLVGRANSLSVVSTYKSTAPRQVLRNPTRSELAYFGVSVSPKTVPAKDVKKVVNVEKKVWKEKSNLVEHYNKTHSSSPIAKAQSQRNTTSRVDSPIYQNIDNCKKKVDNNLSVDYRKREFDPNVLEELNKAAAQMLEAVNGYPHNDSQPSDDERKKPEKLETIAEAKAWKQTVVTSSETREYKKSSTNPKIKPSSSTSSIDSITRECQKVVAPVRQRTIDAQLITSVEKQKKKITAADPSVSKATKARRLQRASSREALLQSHGSSSEDLAKPVETPTRKPRLVKRSKAHTVTESSVKKSTTSQTNFVRKREVDGQKTVERVPGAPLPEIRHKTTVSTIKSTAEKQALREAKALKLKAEEQKRNARYSARKDASSTKNTSSPSNAIRTDRIRVATVTSAKDGTRTSGANVKKSSRTSEGLTRH